MFTIGLATTKVCILVFRNVHARYKLTHLVLGLGAFLGIPPKAWAEEIAVYVHDHIRNAEEVAIYFPNLPARSLNSSEVAMLDADKCEKEALEAKARYESVSKSKFTG